MELVQRVLVVDDFEPWRSYVRNVLQHTVKWKVVGEAADGPDAIQKAEALKPDLILLDIGLPTFSGIKVAEKVLASNPTQRILFISEHRSLSEGALATGARGYIVKSDAGLELLPAMEAIGRGLLFIGKSVTQPVEKPLEHVHRHRHEAGFYADEAVMLNEWTQAAESALTRGHAVIVLAVDSRRHAMYQRLRDCGIDMDGAIRDNRYVSLDLTTVLSQFMIADWPDERLFEKVVTPIIVDALKASTSTRPRVLVCGECAPSLVRDGKENAAVEVEQLWDRVAFAHEVDTLCAYLVDLPVCEERDRVLQRINAVHTEVYTPSRRHS
jgi:DNA-binding NarL/FixJ family response regulator